MPATVPPRRLDSIDALRGLIIVLMAIDHVRDFIHVGAQHFDPLDLTRTYPFLFFTRWITHFCAPVFSFTAGLGAFLWLERPDRTRADLSRFLLTRGLWLIFLELTWMHLAYTFSFSTHAPVFLIVLWILGLSMLVLAALIHVPIRALTVLSLAVIALHNLLDPIRARQFGAFAPLWSILHQPGGFPLFHLFFLSPYPLIPWFAVMSLGFCTGRLFLLVPERRQRIVARAGVAASLAFIVLRAINRYGDPNRWTHQPSHTFTLLSFLDCTKYPPSLLYLLMTLGPALILLAWLDRRTLSDANPLLVFGRTPLFFFLAHFMLAHIIASTLNVLRYGRAFIPLLGSAYPSFGGDLARFPAGFGFPLWAVYAVWLLILIVLYFPCRWLGRLKAQHRHPILSYL